MDDYIAKALRTESNTGQRLLHSAIGMNTEVAELLLGDNTLNWIEELGDVLWYCAIGADELKVSFDDLRLLSKDYNDPIRAMVDGASDCLDVMKRHLFYGLPIDEARFGVGLGTVLQVLHHTEWPIETIMETNIAKLARRYPEKFTTEAAVNRDTAAEMDAISGSQA